MQRGPTWVLLLLLLATPLAAQPALEPGPPRFELETITVENAERISPEILISESLLRTGSSYSESELRDARYRIVRLPFVLDAEFSLRRGSERGLYELVIEVQETRRWFFGFDMDVTRWTPGVSSSRLRDTTEVTTATLVGRRFSVGRHGVFFLAAGGEDGTLQAGYNHYNLLDRNALLAVSYGFAGCGPGTTTVTLPDGTIIGAGSGNECRTDLYELGLDPAVSAWRAFDDSHLVRLDVGLPLRGNESLRFTSSLRLTESGFREPAFAGRLLDFLEFEDLIELRSNLSWVYNSTDEPIFPTSGRTLEAGLSLNLLEADLRNLPFEGFGPDFSAKMDSREVGLQLKASRYWPFQRRQTFWSELDLFAGRSDFDDVPGEGRRLLTGDADVFRGSVTVGHGRFLKRTRVGSRWRDVRWESEAGYQYESTSPSFGQLDNPLRGYRLSSGIAFRNTWGLFRLTFSYLDLDVER